MRGIKNYTGDGWGCVDYVMDENKNLLSYIIKIKSIPYIMKEAILGDGCDRKTAKFIRLHIILHEMGHIACGHYRRCNDHKDYNEYVTQEEEAWLYASQCLKEPVSVLKSIAMTNTEDVEILADLEEHFNIDENNIEEFYDFSKSEFPDNHKR